MTIHLTKITEHLPTKFNEPFKAMAQGICDYSVDVIPLKGKDEFGTMMCVCAEEGAIYITKEQAKIFFGLTE
jgi:hypothetical protein